MTSSAVIIGMHRTGHHAIAVWLLHQRRGIDDFAIKTITPWLFKVENDDGVALLANNPLKRTSDEHPDKARFDDLVAEIDPCDIFITHEQEKLSQVALACGRSSSVSSEKAQTKTIIVLRDFKNWLASCIKMAERDNPIDSIGYMSDYIGDDQIAVYNNHCQLFDNPDTTYILYNRWVEDDSYRKDICDQLGLHFTDAARNQLSIFADGSSFDGMKYIKTASLMKVNQRYKELEDHPTYKQVINDNPDVLSASDEIFGSYK